MLSLKLFSFSKVFVVALALYAEGLHAQPILPSTLASVVPLDNSEVVIARKGQRVFADAKLVFHQLPPILEGAAFIRNSQQGGCKINPLTAGKLIVVTPAKNSPGSQEGQLQAEGFTLLNEPLTKIFNKQPDALRMYSKDVDYKSFRLQPISFKSWVLVFLKPGPLTAHFTAATIRASASPGFEKNRRQWQGCPSIEKTGKRLWSAWFSGGRREPDAGNYGIVAFSDNEGSTWNDPAIIITHPDTTVRVMDTQLWKDPEGTLWIFWVQNQGALGFDGLWSTWAVKLEQPNSKSITWTRPQRLCNGLTRNKPIVLSSGLWLLPSYHWIPDYRSAVYASADKGKSWTLQGGPVNEGSQNFYEHMMVELKDKRVWLLQRNIQESYSIDGGKTWPPLMPLQGLTSANSRLYIGRLHSGNLLLIYNDDPERKARKNLKAFISTDEGKTWPHQLLLDGRDDVSYPDAVQGADGLIYVCYDRSRRGEKEILMAAFTEKDVTIGSFASDKALQKKIISKVEE